MVRSGAMAVLIAGPTASGKSRLALEMARQRNGVVINADSLQVYSELRVLTARPSPADDAEVPHRLYGHVSAALRYSVGSWLGDVAAVLDQAREAGHTPIVVGGTGLYFKALTEGLSTIPAIPAEVRDRVLAGAEGIVSADLHARLAAADPLDAAAIRPSDRARIVRALEVFEATGRPIAAWRQSAGRPLVAPDQAERIVLEIDRAVLHRRIAERVQQMIGNGGLEEARALGALGLPAELSAMKAIGVRELLDHLAGRISLEEAGAAMATATRRYARRQETWFRNQMADWRRLNS
jgi:tRNA dimethylallyltransferase